MTRPTGEPSGLIGAQRVFALVVYYTRSVSESELFEESGGSSAPLKALFSEHLTRTQFAINIEVTKIYTS